MEIFGLTLLTVVAILLALLFDYTNGFHDAANAIATVVATRVLTPLQAVILAAVANFLGPFLFTLAVATTVGKGIVDPSVATPPLVMAALGGAIVWNLITWYGGLPTSSSHALLGGILGAAWAFAGPSAIFFPTLKEGQEILSAVGVGILGGVALFVFIGIWSRIRVPENLQTPLVVGGGSLGVLWVLGQGLGGGRVLDLLLVLLTAAVAGAFVGSLLYISSRSPLPAHLLPAFLLLGGILGVVGGVLLGFLHLGGLTKALLFMVVSPLLGFACGFLFSTSVAWIARLSTPSKVDRVSRHLQIASSAFYALNHGTNDAQKTMGVIAALLFASAPGTSFEIPTWVVLASALAMGLGTLAGGWRIVHTMANRITHLRPYQGMSAEVSSGVVLSAMAHAGIPVSTTHAISASIMGVGAVRRSTAVRWKTGRRIVGAWIFTIPAAALLAFLLGVGLRAFL